MSFVVQLTAGSYIEFASNATLEPATKIYGAFSVKGDLFATLAALGAGEAGIDYIGKPDGSIKKAGLTYLVASATFTTQDGINTYTLGNHSGLTLAGFDAGTYYDCAWHCDPTLASNTGELLVYAQGDLGGTVLARWWTDAAMSAMMTGAGGAVRFLGGINGSFGLTSVAGTYDWAKLGTDTTYADEDATLEEGTGTAVSPSGTITNSSGVAGSTPADYSWVSLTPADHGVVTLPTNPVAIGAGDTATVSWKDASGNTITPQPTTTWTVLGAGATINSSTGAYVGAAGGTATIKAQTGIVVATATLTITRRLSFTGTMTVT